MVDGNGTVEYHITTREPPISPSVFGLAREKAALTDDLLTRKRIGAHPKSQAEEVLIGKYSLELSGPLTVRNGRRKWNC